MSGKTPAERLQNAWIKLQIDVNCFMDSDLDKISLERSPGIRQVVEWSALMSYSISTLTILSGSPRVNENFLHKCPKVEQNVFRE